MENVSHSRSFRSKDSAKGVQKQARLIIPRCSLSSLFKSKDLKRILSVLKMSLILLAFTLFQAVATSSYSQTTPLTVKTEQVALTDLFALIEKQSDFLFFYVDADVKNIKVSVNASGKSVEEVLSAALRSTRLSYSIVGRNINIYPKNAPGSSPKKKISGRVNDPEGNAIIGANVVEKGTTNGTITDVEGKFQLEVSENAIVEFSYIGYITQLQPVEGQEVMRVSLKEDTQKLDEVVVVGYGTQTKREITGSITNVTSEDFNQGLTRNAADLLQGKVAGLSINTGSGDVTSSSTIQLRGMSTLQKDQGPLIVIDNVPGADMSTVSPQDIESISILKDASSAAIYGSRSAGGVILITTKKGYASHPTIAYTGAFGVSTLANKPNLLTAEKWRAYTSSTAGKDGKDFDRGANTDWFDEITRLGFQQDHNVSLSGGGSHHNYRGSLSYMQREGIARDNSLTRYNARFQFSQRALEDRLKVNMTGVATITNNEPTNSTNFLLAYNMIPVRPVKLDDGSWFDTREYDQGNPVRNQDENKHLNRINNFYGTADISYSLWEGLDVKALLAKSRQTEDESIYNSIESQAGYNDGGNAERTGRLKDKDLMEWTATYSAQFHKHKINALIGYSWEQENREEHTVKTRGFTTDLLGANDLASGQHLNPGDATAEKKQSRLISLYARANYSFNEKYMFTATVRRDGSSKFGANHKWGTFPSVSAAWNLTGESFMQRINWLNDLKLSVGYGLTGNQAGLEPYTTHELYGAKGLYYDNGAWLPSYRISQNANPDLKWEQTAMLNVGLDFSVFDSRLGGRIEWYDKRTSDMLYTYPVPTPPYLYGEVMANVGNMKNSGIELSLNAEAIRTKDFGWTISLNLAHNKNEVTRLSNDVFSMDKILLGDVFVRGGSSSGTHVLEEGRPIGQFYGLVCKGLDENGRYILVDKDEDGEISDPADYDYIGSAQPKLTYGITNMFRYKNFDLSFFLRGTLGNDILNATRLAYAQAGFLPGTNALDDPLTYTLSETPRFSSYYLEKGSFMRLDNLTLGYKIKAFNGIRVYLTAQNLFVITKYKGLDPEVSMESENGLAPGIEPREFYPKARTFSVGVNLNF